MKIYKEKQFLIFEYEDGKTCKYDFATKTAYGRSGMKVKDLRTQLRNLSVSDMIESCESASYGRFIRFVARHASPNCRPLENIGTILSRLPKYSNYEQIFSAGIEDIVGSGFKYSINDIPKALIKICKTRNITLYNDFLEYYKEIPDAYQIAYKLEYISLTDRDINRVLQESRYVNGRNRPYFNDLILNYGYNAKSLMKYIDTLKTLEAIDDTRYVIRELYDYARMASQISPKYDRHPKHFLTTMKIASRNFNRLSTTYDESKFAQRIDTSMERTIGDYVFIYPKSTQDIKDEAVQQNNCVSSYINSVINGHCHILFMRRKAFPEVSLITIEVRNGQIIQALKRFNHEISDGQRDVVNKWNEWYANVLEQREKEKVA